MGTNGTNIAIGEEYVDTYSGLITQLTYSTYIVNQSTGKGTAFGNTIDPDAGAWSHEDEATTGSGYITGTFSAQDITTSYGTCYGTQSDSITI